MTTECCSLHVVHRCGISRITPVCWPFDPRVTRSVVTFKPFTTLLFPRPLPWQRIRWLCSAWGTSEWIMADCLRTCSLGWVGSFVCVCFCVCAFCWRKFITTLRDNQHLDKQKNTKSISTTTPIPNTHPTSTQMMMIIKEICIVLVFHIRQKATTSTNEKEGQKPKVQTNTTVNVNTDNCGHHSGDKRRTEIQSKNKHSCKC